MQDGIHILINVVDCLSKELNNAFNLEELLRSITDFCEVKVIRSFSHKNGSGPSLIDLLDKGHVALHSQPEKKFVTCDIFFYTGADIKFMQLKKMIEDWLQGQATFVLLSRSRDKIKLVTTE